MEWGDVRRWRCWGRGRKTGRAVSRSGWTQRERVGAQSQSSPGWGIHGLLLPQRKTQAQHQLRSPRYGKYKVILGLPTSTCLVKSTPLPAHLHSKLSKPLSHQSHLPPGQCRWSGHSQALWAGRTKGLEAGKKGACRVQARTCGRRDHSLGLV